MQLIAEAEGERRGLYGGAVGYLGYDGNLDTAITIRSAILKEDLIHMHVGAGIVAKSEHKAGAIRRALEMAIAETASGGGSGTTTSRGTAAGTIPGSTLGSGPEEASR
jgi:anthranilate synthase component 1